jgi:hypothetical protein
VPPLLAILNVLAHPLGHAGEVDLPDGAQLEVLAYYPFVRPGRYRAAQPGARSTFPAAKIGLSSPMAGNLREDWIALPSPGKEQISSAGPALMEFLGRCPRAMLDEFRNPPPAAELGEKGQLVLSLGGQKYRLDVDKVLKHEQPLGTAGWRVKITDYSPAPGQDASAAPVYPSVGFDMIGPDGKTISYAVFARYTGTPRSSATPPKDLEDLQVWYHPPDYRWGDNRLRGLLDFVQGDDGRLYYRSFHSQNQGFEFEHSGEAQKSKDGTSIWKGMNWKFQVVEYLPDAVREDQWVPVDYRPGIERESDPAALRCRLRKGGKKSDEFWVVRKEVESSKIPMTPVKLGNDEYRIGMRMKTDELPFQIKLLRAEETKDPSSGQSATYASYVQLTDKEQNLKDEDHVISMNAPLYHRGYKFYQSGYVLMTVDANERPVSTSTFTVGYDPGIYLKYLGQAMLGLGIFFMFYFKAYFFKPRRRKAAATKPAEEV